MSASAYSFGFMVQRGIAFLLLPVYTSVLNPAQYGEIGLLLALYSAVSVVMALGLDTHITRSYFQLEADPETRQSYIDSVWRVLVGFPIALAMLVGTLAWVLFDGAGGAAGRDVLLTLVAAALSVSAGTLPLAVLRARQDLKGYLWMTGVSAIGTTTFLLLAVVVWRGGVTGWMLATVVSNALLLVVAMVAVPWRRGGGIRWDLVKAALAFSLPLLPHFLSHWALQLADRGLLATIVSRDELGVYTLAGNVAGLVMMLVMAINQGFLPAYGRAGTVVDTGDDSELRRTVMLQITLVAVITAVAAMLAPPAILLITPTAYHGAAALIPWMVIGYGFLGLYFIPMNGATVAAGRSRFAWIATAVSAVTNLVLISVFAPRHGIEAAAVAAAAGYLILLLLMALWAHSAPNPVRYEWAGIRSVLLLAATSWLLNLFTKPSGSLGGLASGLLWSLILITVTLLVARRFHKGGAWPRA